MNITLVRHFRVQQPFPKGFLVNYDQLVNWFDAYEAASIEIPASALPARNWTVCYASPTKRAIETAGHIFNGNIIRHDALKELNILSLLDPKRKLPFLLWGIKIRNISVSTNPITDAFRKKTSLFMDELLAAQESDVLIVGHGFVMMQLQQELLRRGFTGSKFRNPRNGQPYVYRKA